MKNKKAIAEIKIYKDSTVDTDIKCDKNQFEILVAGIFKIIKEISCDDNAKLYAMIASIIVLSGIDIDVFKEGIDWYEQQ